MAPSTRSRLLMATLVFPLVACAGSDGPAPGLDGPDRFLDWEREPAYTLGGFESTDWQAFGDVESVGFDAEGNLYILDTQASTVSVVDPDGQLVRTFGTRGEGPGELQNPQSMAVFPDGSVAIYDFGKFGFVTYGPDGEWVDDVTSSATGNMDLLGRLAAGGPGLGSGQATLFAERVGRIRMSRSAGNADAESEPEPPGDPIVRVDLQAGADLDPSVVFRAWEPPEPEGPDEEISGGTSGGGQFAIRMGPLEAFTPNMEFAVLPDGRFVVSDSTTYRLELRDPAGELIGEIARPIAPVAVTPAIQDAERARRIAQQEESEADGGGSGRVVVFGGGGGGGQMDMSGMNEAMRRQIESMVFYPEIPAIADLAADWENRIWVQRADSEPGERGPIDILTPEGDYIGTLSADGPETPAAFGPNGLAAWIETDEFDVARIVVARIVAADPTT